MLNYSVEPIFSYHLQLNPTEVIGPVPEGIRANVYPNNGTVTGEKVQGILRSVGGDWVTIRPDGVGITDGTSHLSLAESVAMYQHR